MCGKRFEVGWISRQDGSARFGHSNDKRVYSGPSAGPSAQQGSSPGHPLRHVLDDVAGLQELISDRVTPCVTLKAFHQDH